VYVNIYIILDDYVTARRNLPLAELTSDFPSKCEEKIVGKRQHKKNKKYFTESSDSQEENSMKLKKGVSKITKKIFATTNEDCQVAQIYLKTKKMTPVLSKNPIILSCRYHKNFNKNQSKF